MYCNFTKCQAFPLAIRASSQRPRCFLQFYTKPKIPQFLPSSNWENLFCCSGVTSIDKTHEYGQLLGPGNRDSSVYFNRKQVWKKREQAYAAKRECFPNGFHSKPRSFSTSYSRRVAEATNSGNPLPWLAKSKDKEGKDSGRSAVRQSSWEGASKNGVENREKDRRHVRRKDHKTSRNPEDESATRKVVRSSWEESPEKFVKSGVVNRDKDRRHVRRKEHKTGRNDEDESPTRKVVRSSWEELVKRGGEDRERSRRFDERNEDRDSKDVESQEVDNPRWYEIKDRFDRFDSMVDAGQNGGESRRWNRQENWGKKVWKEATESSIPKMVGECVYGVGPVLAALSANRREFYFLYVQEGVDLSRNNKKKKDKKGFEKVLRVAEKLGITKQEISKHDLNMITDNRPHQGLVLDASPLEMVNIRELERVGTDGEEGCPLWLALDEVMDPQNLGAIIRSAYFFGASGVVLCAKNSAPLSGVVSKASAGSLELTELRSCKNMMQFLVSSAENGWRVVGGSVSSRAVSLDEVTRGEPTVLVLGSEGTGLRPLVERSCSLLVKIPGSIPSTAGSEDEPFLAVESLNVSVAAGVLLHHLVGTKRSKD